MKYYLKDKGIPREDAVSFRATVGEELNMADWLAEDAAADFWNEQGGYDCTWPIVFTLIFDGGSEIDVMVDTEAEPTFHGYVVLKDINESRTESTHGAGCRPVLGEGDASRVSSREAHPGRATDGNEKGAE